MTKQSNNNKTIAINDSRFPISITGHYDPNEIIAAAKTAMKAASVATLLTPKSDSRCVVVLDTTGLDPESDEIIGICILRRARNQTVFSKRFKPVRHTSWHAAQDVNGIAPEDVASSDLLSENINVIQGIIDSCSGIIAYNAEFVARFLDAAGLDLGHTCITDAMVEYSGFHRDDTGKPVCVTLMRAISEITRGQEPGRLGIEGRAECVSVVQSFLDDYYVSITDQFCSMQHAAE